MGGVTGLYRYLSERPGAAGFLLVFMGYCTFVLYPILGLLRSGEYFGWDIGEYVLTARLTLTGSSGLFRYPFPLLPTLYLPLAAWNPGLPTLYLIADLFSGLLMIGMFLGAGSVGYSIGRSSVAASACAVIVGTFSLLLGEIGWGGQAQLLAFLLGLFALAALIRGRIPGTSVRAELAVGILLFFAVLAEAYSGAYFVVAALLFTVLTRGRRVLSRREFRDYCPVVFLPLAALSLIVLTGGYLSASTVEHPVLPYALTVGGWTRAISGIGFGNPLNAYGYVVLLGALAVLILFGDRPVGRARALLIATFGACFIQVLLLTPVIYWDRAEFFVVFPLAAATAVMAPGIPRSVGRVLSARRLSLQKSHPVPGVRRKQWVELGCSLVVVVVVFSQSAVAYELYSPALHYYSVNPNELSALTWLRGAPGSVLVVSPAGQTFSIANAIGRPIYPLSQPLWYDTPAQRNAVELATDLTAGRQWIDAGPLTIVDTGAPTNSSSPAIFDYGYPYMIKLFDVEEGEGSAPALTGPQTGSARGAPAPIPVGTSSFSDTDQLPTYNVQKVVSVGQNGTVSVSLTFQSTGGPFEPTYVAMQVPQATLRSATPSGTSEQLVESFEYGGNPEVSFVSTSSLAAPSDLNVGSPVESEVAGTPTVFWSISAGPGFSGSEFNVSLAIHVEGVPRTGPALVDESSVLSENDIRWVVVDLAADSTALPRFSHDPQFALSPRSDSSFDVFQVT